MTKGRRRVLWGAIALLLAAGACILLATLWFPSSATFGPTDAELTQADRASQLVGRWSYLGVIGRDDAKFIPGGHMTATFAPNGQCRYEGMNHWAVDQQGQLHIRLGNGSQENGHQQFFFRGGYLYLEGDDGTWEKWQRQ